MPLLEAHIILYGLLAIDGVVLAISAYYTTLEVILVHKEIKQSNARIHKELNKIRKDAK